MKKSKQQKGSIIIILIIILILSTVGYFLYKIINENMAIGLKKTDNSTSTPTPSVTTINSNSCDYQYDNEPEDVIRCDIDDNLVFVYTPEKKAEIIKKIDNQVLNTFYSYQHDDVSGKDSDFIFEDNLNNFEFVDINFDGIRDLKVLQSSGAYNYTYSFYIYDVKEGKYRIDPKLKELVNAYFEEVKGEGFIYDFYKGRGIADIYSTSDFRYNKKTLQYEEIENCTRDFLGNDFSEEDGYYYYCKRPDSKNKSKISILSFDAVGNEYLRSCPSSSCPIIKHSANIPEIEFIKKEGDWYEVNYIEKGDQVDGEVIELNENQWLKIKGWIYKSDVPKVIQDLID